MNATYFKASQMGHFVMVSLWCASTNARFRFLYIRINKQGQFDIPTSHFSERFLFRNVFIPGGRFSKLYLVL